MRAFASKNLHAKGKVLEYSECRLFADLGELTPNPKRIARIVAKAEEFLNTDIPLLPASVYREYFVNGNRSNYQSIYFRRRDMAVYLAMAEYYEKKGRFSEKLMDVVWAIMEESSWVIPAHLYLHNVGFEYTLPPVFGNNYNHGIDLFAAATAGALTCVYHYAKDALDAITPIICEKLEYELHQRIVRPYLESPFWWTGDSGRSVNNWNPWIISNILHQTAWMEKSLYIREKVVEKAMFHLDNFINGYPPDGGCDEGPSYWGAAGASLFDCLELLEDMSGGKISIYDTEIVKNIGEYIFKMNIDGSRFVNFADCPPRTSPTPTLLIRYGEKCNSPFLVSFGKKQATFGEFFFSQSHMYRSLKSLFTPETEAEKCPMPTLSILPDLKVMTARSTPDSARSTFLAIKGGSNGEQHNHNDVGNFMVYYDGKPVIIDTGVGEYTRQTFSPQRYELWFMQSGYHNLPSFGGVDERAGSIYRSTDEQFEEGIPSYAMQLKEAYPEAAGIVSYVRRGTLDGEKVIITDTVELTEEKEIDFHLMSHVAPVLNDNGTISLAEGKVLTYDPATTPEIEEFAPVGMNTKGSWETETIWRIHLRVTAKSGSYTITIE
ncbi:MAG: heparinase II/III-family protein [Clostridia bacterium]|nr:heparinase II/III-family protein [Clostridia bacterium]